MANGARLAKFVVSYLNKYGLPPKKVSVTILIILWLVNIYCTARLVFPIFDYYHLSETTQVFIAGSETSIETDQGTIQFEKDSERIFFRTDRLQNLQSGDKIVVKTNRITRRVIDISADGNCVYRVTRTLPDLGAICAGLVCLYALMGATTFYVLREINNKKITSHARKNNM